MIPPELVSIVGRAVGIVLVSIGVSTILTVFAFAGTPGGNKDPSYTQGSIFLGMLLMMAGTWVMGLW